MSQHWDLDPKTGDYLLAGGSPIQVDSLRVPAYYRLKVRRNTWLYAPNDKYGSDFHLIKKRITGKDTSSIEGVAARALQPIADDGRAARLDISAVEATRHGVGLSVKILEQNGRLDQLSLPGLGV